MPDNAITLAVLLSFLAVILTLRNREALWDRLDVWLRPRQLRQQWQQSSIDAASLSKHIAQLRQDPIANVHLRRSHQEARRLAMDSARDLIHSRSYFQNLKADGEHDECEHEKHAA